MKISSKRDFLFLGKEKFTVEDWNPVANPVINLKDIKKKYSKVILQIDGGGIRGVLPSYILYTIEEKTQTKVIDCVDIIYGCSTGAIIAALLCKFSMKEIMEFYIVKGPSAFQEKFAWGGVLWGNLYNPSFIEVELTKYFGSTTFKQLYDQTGKELNIMVVDIKAKEPIMCNYQTCPAMPIWVAVRGSMSAPIYFGPFEWNNLLFYDGGTGEYGCTARPAANDAIFTRKWDPKDFYLVSLGTGYYTNTKTTKEILGMNKIEQFQWVWDYSRYESTQTQVKFLEYRKQDYGLNYFRWDLQIPENLTAMDKTDNINELIKVIDK